MKKILTTVTFALTMAGCASSNKQIAPIDHQITTDQRLDERSPHKDSELCEIIMETHPYFIEALAKGKDAMAYDVDLDEKCPCVETITCSDVDYCSASKCPSEEKPSSIFIFD